MNGLLDRDRLTIDGVPFEVRYYLDEGCPSPMEGFDDEVKITYKKGSRHILGTTQVDDEEDEALRADLRRGKLIGLPVYAYIHSGVALRAASGNVFADEWDSGRSGLVYCSREYARKEWGGGKRLSAKAADLTLQVLRTTVEEFGAWVNGECYRYEVARLDEDGDGDVLAEGAGYVGDLRGAREDAAADAKGLAADILAERRTAWFAMLHEAREARYWARRDVLTRF